MPEPISISMSQDFTDQYISLRKKEGRIYSDEELIALPRISNHHPLKYEWKIRERSSNQLIRYLLSKKKPIKLLEMGCGNGWLSNLLAQNETIEVIGMDINKPELDQGKKVFHKPNLQLKYGRLGEDPAYGKYFDIIVFASSIQYFPSLQNTINKAMHWLKPDGEIHILDSHFYSDHAKVKARVRSQEYFQSIGLPLMHQYYFHHSFHDLGNFTYTILNRFRLELEKLMGTGPAFPWILIKNNLCTSSL